MRKYKGSPILAQTRILSRIDAATSSAGCSRLLRRWSVVAGGGALLSLAGYTPGAGSPASPPRPWAGSATVADVIHDLAVGAFADGLGEVVLDGGLLTDELREPLSGPGSRRTTLGPVAAGGEATGGWPYSSKYPWRRLSWLDIRNIPERWTEDLAEPKLVRTSQEALLDNAYLELQGARAVLHTARAQLDAVPPAGGSPAVLRSHRGELYALEGYAEVLLADLFCSGVPLNTFAQPLEKILVPGPETRVPDSLQDVFFYDYVKRRLATSALWFGFSRSTVGGEPRVNFEGARKVYLNALAQQLVVYRPGSTTAEVYRHALALLDTAQRLAGDSARILNLARVGRGRVYLALGEYDSAAAAVAQVPRGFAYQVRSFLNLDSDGDEVLATVADREGGTGFPYLSSQDPRTVTKQIKTDKGMGDVRFPAKFWPDSDRAKFQQLWTAYFNDDRLGNGNPEEYELSQLYYPFTLADWKEAVLIRAEAVLQIHPADGTWLQLLNQLRTTAPIPGKVAPDAAQLPPLKDPGTAHGRLALLFAERAAWLFLTGHRQGDLRRLVRNYHWPQDQVYPSGPYLVSPTLLPQVGQYGTDVNLPIPPQEMTNPLFLGCLDRGA